MLFVEVEFAMTSDDKLDQARVRSRSRSGHCRSDRSKRSRRRKTVKDSQASHAACECSHLPPPPCRPAGPFALFFAANHANVEAKNVIGNNELTHNGSAS